MIRLSRELTPGTDFAQLGVTLGSTLRRGGPFSLFECVRSQGVAGLSSPGGIRSAFALRSANPGIGLEVPA